MHETANHDITDLVTPLRLATLLAFLFCTFPVRGFEAAARTLLNWLQPVLAIKDPLPLEGGGSERGWKEQAPAPKVRWLVAE